MKGQTISTDLSQLLNHVHNIKRRPGRPTERISAVVTNGPQTKRELVITGWGSRAPSKVLLSRVRLYMIRRDCRNRIDSTESTDILRDGLAGKPARRASSFSKAGLGLRRQCSIRIDVFSLTRSGATARKNVSNRIRSDERASPHNWPRSRTSPRHAGVAPSTVSYVLTGQEVDLGGDPRASRGQHQGARLPAARWRSRSALEPHGDHRTCHAVPFRPSGG